MGSPVFHTDPSIALRGVSRPFDPIAAFSRIARLRRLQQLGQINQQQLEDMERERSRVNDIRSIAAGAFEPGKGLNRADFLQALAPKHPLVALEFESQFAGQAREAEKDKAALRKTRLENARDIFRLIGQLAGPLDALEKSGADLETMQVAYADSLGRLEAIGVDVSKLPQEYTPGLPRRALVESQTEKDRIGQALRADEIAERKAAREKKVPGVHVPFPPAVFKQKQELARARLTVKPPDPKVQIRAQEIKDRAMTRAAENYLKRIDALEKTWIQDTTPPEEGGRGEWINRNTGVRINNQEYLAKRREAEDQLISSQEQADLSFLEKLETAGFEPGLPVDFRAQARARRGQSPTTPEAAAAQTFEEGDIFVNHETGERIVLRGGKWVPAPRR